MKDFFERLAKRQRHLYGTFANRAERVTIPLLDCSRIVVHMSFILSQSYHLSPPHSINLKLLAFCSLIIISLHSSGNKLVRLPAAGLNARP